MQSKKNYFLILIFIFNSFVSHAGQSVDSHEEKVSSSTRILKIVEAPTEILVPPKLWDLLDGSSGHVAAAKEKGASHEPETEDIAKVNDTGFDLTKNSQIFLFSRVNVFIKAKVEGVLKETSYKFEFPKGGGEIDLASLVGPINGSFFISFELPDWSDLKDSKVFFLSRSKKRKIDGEIFGSGCNKIINVTSTLAKSAIEGGIKVNTTNDRHLAVLGGSFFFVAKKSKETFLSQVTITDSSKKKLFCREN